MRQSKQSSERRSDILGLINPRTRVIALFTLIVEALFVVASYSIPPDQRLVALIICATLLLAAIVACVWIEVQLTQREDYIGDKLVVPEELKQNIIWVDKATERDQVIGSDIYRTASNLKFAGKYELAISHYKKVVEVAPTHWKALYNIGSCLDYLGRCDEAEKAFKALIKKMKPRESELDESGRMVLFGCYIQLNKISDLKKNYDEGQKYLLDSLKVKPDNALAYINLTISAVKSGNREEALKWHQILMKHPEQIQVMTFLSTEDRQIIESLGGAKRELVL